MTSDMHNTLAPRRLQAPLAVNKRGCSGNPSVKVVTERHALSALARTRRVRRVGGVVGLVIAVPFFLWLPLGLLSEIPSMTQVFGIAGLRTPASFVIAGLLLAAIGFFEA